MKQLGNLAIVCAQRKDVLFQLLDGEVTVHIGRGSDKAMLHASWDNDEKISDIIREFNFGRFRSCNERGGQIK